MKYIWEDEDIKSGRYVTHLVGNLHEVDPRDIAHGTSKLCYTVGSDRQNEKRWYLVALIDGAIYGQSSRKGLVELLNKDGYRPLQHQHLLKAVDSIRNTNEGL